VSHRFEHAMVPGSCFSNAAAAPPGACTSHPARAASPPPGAAAPGEREGGGGENGLAAAESVMRYLLEAGGLEDFIFNSSRYMHMGIRDLW
jgi:hypothetical protein